MRTINKIFLLLTLAAAALASCKDDYPSLDLGKEAYITAFSVDGVEGVIDNENFEVSLIMPPGSDLTMARPVVRVSEGASVTPPDGMVQNLTGPVTYTVVNGGTFNDYTVRAEVVDAQITALVLDGKYQATINNLARTIRVTIPNGTDLTALEVYAVYTEGATLTPDAGTKIDLTKPVTFTLSYKDYNFIYEVNLTQRDEAFAFVGEPGEVSQLSGDERAAAEWMMATFPNCRYISFESIHNGSTDLADYDVIWWHYHYVNHPFSLPGVTVEAAVLQAFRDFINGGGGLYLSSFANEYVVNLGLTEFSPFNKWGDPYDNPIRGEPGEWGISGDGNYDHPIFEGLPRIWREAGDSDGHWQQAHDWIPLQSRFATRTNKACIWNLDAGETAHLFNDPDGFESVVGARALASFDWDGWPLNRVAIAEFQRVMNGRGPVICNGAASYEWWNCGDTDYPNEFRGNIELLTRNIINHLRK